MRELTHDQADRLRAIRPRVLALKDALDIPAAVSEVCDHEGFVPGCPVCRVWRRAKRVEEFWEELSVELDRALLRGPHPEDRS